MTSSIPHTQPMKEIDDERYFVAFIESPGANPLFYTGWLLPKAEKVPNQFGSRDQAWSYGSIGQARISRSKILKARPTIREEQLVIMKEEPI